MTDGINNLETEALRLLLDGDDPVLAILRKQLLGVINVRRECNGLGDCLYFKLASDCPRLPGNPSFAISDVYCELDGQQEQTASLILFVEDGLISLLETAAFGESWPTDVKRFRVHYQKGNARDLETLRRIPGWPQGTEGKEKGNRSRPGES